MFHGYVMNAQGKMCRMKASIFLSWPVIKLEAPHEQFFMVRGTCEAMNSSPIFASTGEHSPPEAAPDTRLPEAGPRGRLILVAEDDTVNQRLISLQLDSLGYAAEIAGDGIEALRMWRSGRYALLLTDLRMPKMDGYMLTEHIRQEEEGRERMPILALSANILGDEKRSARDSGIDQYLTKPIEIKSLQDALQRWLPAAGNAVQAAEAPSVNGAQTVSSVLDLSVLKSLVGDDDPQIVQEVLVEYKAAAFPQARELEAAFAAGDVYRVGAIAHKLKSSSRSIGAMALGNLCAEMEIAGQEGDVAVIAQKIPCFETAIAAVEAAIAGLLVDCSQ